jgi:tRNA (guanine37-N1)-methyltransferase
VKFTVITLFPNIIHEYINTSIIGRAKDSQKIQVEVIDLRNFGKGKRKNVDDTVYGGGSRNGYNCSCFR